MGMLPLFVGRALVEAQQVECLLHMGRQGRGDIQHAAIGMRNDDAARMQMQPFLDAARETPSSRR